MPEQRKQRICTIEFTGLDSEYFKIWFKNIILVILTLGMYASRAVTETRSYLYQHSHLNEVRFEYHGGADKILGSHFLMAVLLLLCALFYLVYPGAEWILSITVILMLPWLIVTEFSARAELSSYRGVSFHFYGNYLQALGVYVGISLLVVLTAGIAYPYLVYRHYQYVTEHTTYGHVPFQFVAKPADFYNIYFTAFLFFIAPAAAFIASISLLLALGPTGVLVLSLLALVMSCYVYAFVQAEKINLLFGSLALSEHRLYAKLDAMELFNIYITNIFLLLVTLGLAVPWAKIRLMRHMAGKISLLSGNNFEQMIVAEQRNTASINGSGVFLSGMG